jgi:RNA polymerase sigma-70 factor (ECF subfamily)
MVRDRAEAEDITQTAFMKIHRALPGLDPERDPTSWVFAVVANTLRDYWRSRHYRQGLRHDPLEDAEPRAAGNPLADAEARDTARILARALDGLPEGHRAVVHLRDIENLSYAEVAQALGIAEAAARKRHSRALADLRQALAEEGLLATTPRTRQR